MLILFATFRKSLIDIALFNIPVLFLTDVVMRHPVKGSLEMVEPEMYLQKHHQKQRFKEKQFNKIPAENVLLSA